MDNKTIEEIIKEIRGLQKRLNALLIVGFSIFGVLIGIIAMMRGVSGFLAFLPFLVIIFIIIWITKREIHGNTWIE